MYVHMYMYKYTLALRFLLTIFPSFHFISVGDSKNIPWVQLVWQ